MLNRVFYKFLPFLSCLNSLANKENVASVGEPIWRHSNRAQKKKISPTRPWFMENLILAFEDAQVRRTCFLLKQLLPMFFGTRCHRLILAKPVQKGQVLVLARGIKQHEMPPRTLYGRVDYKNGRTLDSKILNGITDFQLFPWRTVSVATKQRAMLQQGEC